MREHRPFTRLFSLRFALITAVSVAVYIFFGLRVVDAFFAYYVDRTHEETQRMLAMQAAAQYRMMHSWDGHAWEDIGTAARAGGDYFTIKDNQGRVVYSTGQPPAKRLDNENGAKEAEAADGAYVLTRRDVLVDGAKVGELTAGYYAGQIASAEAEAFRKSGVWLIVLAILCISLSAALVSLLFFHRLSRPIRDIAATAGEMAGGKLGSRVALRSEVAEMHEIGDAINALGASLQKQETFRRRLVVELSHELRTPLQILLNQVEAMLDGVHEADPPRLEAMREEIARTGELLNELEDRLIYENDTFELNVERTDISEVTRKVALGYEGSFSRKSLAFLRDIEPGVFVDADSVRYAQVLINLLSNALKYTDSGSVSLTLKRGNANAEVTVADTGPGIAPERIASITSRSEQAFTAVNSKGVGLYIASLIVRKHGWRLCIDSEIHTGTRVSVIMPVSVAK